MKRAAIIIALLATAALAEGSAPHVIAADSNGVVVQVKEKYGAYTIDTCTVVMLVQGQFVLVHRDRGSGWYPASFHSVQVLQNLSAEKGAKPQDAESETRQPLAFATKEH